MGIGELDTENTAGSDTVDGTLLLRDSGVS